MFDSLVGELIKDSLGKANKVEFHDYYKYRISYITDKDLNLMFLFVTGLTDNFDNIKKELVKCKKEFLNLFEDILQHKFDEKTFEVFDPTVDSIHRNLRPKISLVGFSGVGKTTITRLIKAEEIPMQHIPTITGDIATIKIGKLHFHLWDFAGQEQFSYLWNNFIKGSDAVLLITDSSLENVEKSKFFLELIKEQAPSAHTAIIANKQDLEDILKPEQIEKILGLKAYSMIAKEAQNRDKMIQIIADILEMSSEISPLLRPLLKRDTLIEEATRALQNAQFQVAADLFEKISDLCIELGDDSLGKEFFEKSQKIKSMLQSAAKPSGPAPKDEPPQEIEVGKKDADKIKPLDQQKKPVPPSIPEKTPVPPPSPAEKVYASEQKKYIPTPIPEKVPMPPPTQDKMTESLPPSMPPVPPTASTSKSEKAIEGNVESPYFKPPKVEGIKKVEVPTIKPEEIKHPPASEDGSKAIPKPLQHPEVTKKPVIPIQEPQKLQPPVIAPKPILTPTPKPVPIQMEPAKTIPEAIRQKEPEPGLILNPEDFLVKQRPKTVTSVPKDARSKLRTSPFAQVTNAPPSEPTKAAELTTLKEPVSMEKNLPPFNMPPLPTPQSAKPEHPIKAPSVKDVISQIPLEHKEAPIPIDPTKMVPKGVEVPSKPSEILQRETPKTGMPDAMLNENQKADIEKSLMDLKIKRANISKMALDFDMKELTGEITSDELEEKKAKLKVFEEKIESQIKDLEKMLRK